MTTYLNPYTGQTVNQSPIGYESLTLSSDTTLQWPINGNTTSVVAGIIEVTATSSSLKLILPPATQVSTGQSILVRNVGSNTFIVADNSGNTIASIASGIADYIYLTDNTTINGTWAVVVFGAGVSQANAATLAGYGLMAIGSTLNQSHPVINVSSTYSLQASDRSSFYVWSGGAGALTLPSAAIVGNNWFVIIRNSGTGILTLTPTGADTIDSNVNQQLQLTESLVICSNGTNGFSTFAYGRSNLFVYTQLVVTLTGGTTTLTAAQAANSIQSYNGTLTSNATVILPSTVNLYSLQNNTTGSFTLTFKTTATGATTVVLPQNQTVIAICDGINVYNSQTASTSTATQLTLGNGSSSAPSLNFTGDTVTGLYLVTSGQLGFSLSGANAMTLSSTGLAVPAGISGGTF
jgi:hypothetical protein